MLRSKNFTLLSCLPSQRHKHFKRILNTGVIISIQLQAFTQSNSAGHNVNNTSFKSCKHELFAA